MSTRTLSTRTMSTRASRVGAASALAAFSLTVSLAAAAAAPPSADRLLAVELERDRAAGEAAAVRIVGNGAFAYSTLRLSAPERFVVDLEGVVQGLERPRLAVGEPELERVRVGQFRGAPAPVTRVVFDLGPETPPGSPRIERAAGELRVVFAAAERETAPVHAKREAAPVHAEAAPVQVEREAAPVHAEREAAPAHAERETAPTYLEPEPEPELEPRRAPRPPSRLVASAQLDDLSSGEGGGGGALTWIRPGAGGETYFAGLSSYRLAESRWAYARLGGAARRGRLAFSGELQRGRGEDDERGGAEFDYELYRAGLTVELIARRFYLELEDRYLDVDTSRGNLVKAGFLVAPVPRLTGSVAFVRSTGGNFDADFVQGRIDLRAGRVRLLAGFADGRTRPVSLGLVGAGPGGEFDQLFGGLAFPLGGAELTVVADRLEFDKIDRQTLTLSLSTPLRATGSP